MRGGYLSGVKGQNKPQRPITFGLLTASLGIGINNQSSADHFLPVKTT